MHEYMDMNNSPDRMQTLKPRVLTYGLSPEIDNKNSIDTNYLQANLNESPRKQPTCSPPYRKVRALRLFDTPTTPKTIIQKSALNKPTNLPKNHRSESIFTKKSVVSSSRLSAIPTMTATNTTTSTTSTTSHDRPTALHVHNRVLDNVYNTSANVNPFSPNSLSQRNMKRSRTITPRTNGHNYSMVLPDILSKSTESSQKRRSVASLFSNYVDNNSEDETNDVVQAPKRLALQDSNITRYAKEFVELSRIGVGEFGYVYHCLNRLDGCDYAIKKSIKPVAGSIFEKTALNEVWAHAVLGKHDNVVRYYSAWAEDNHMLIQNEFCNGGSLQTALQKRVFVESELRTLLMHIASGLKYIHSNDLVHMDLKAGNIFMSKIPAKASTFSTEYCDDGFEDELDTIELVTYKIGDLGHVTSINDPQVEEGDCRYLPKEILREDFSQLCKADIFALGITLYEAGGGGPLPKNGPDWHMLRNGEIPDLPRLSREFNDLIKCMTHPDPQTRPSSTTIFNHPVLSMCESKSKAQLHHELNIQRQKNEILLRKLRESAILLKSYELASTPSGRKHRNSPAVSDRKLRSFSRRSSQRQRSSARTGYRDQNKNVVGDIDIYI